MLGFPTIRALKLQNAPKCVLETHGNIRLKNSYICLLVAFRDDYGVFHMFHVNRSVNILLLGIRKNINISVVLVQEPSNAEP